MGVGTHRLQRIAAASAAVAAVAAWLDGRIALAIAFAAAAVSWLAAPDVSERRREQAGVVKFAASLSIAASAALIVVVAVG